MQAEMHNESWLRLTDYASKYRISISTLRRRIKHGQIAHKFDDGRYLILDQAPSFAESSAPELSQASYQQPPQTAFASIVRHRAQDESDSLVAEAQERLNQMRELTGPEETTDSEDSSVPEFALEFAQEPVYQFETESESSLDEDPIVSASVHSIHQAPYATMTSRPEESPEPSTAHDVNDDRAMHDDSIHSSAGRLMGELKRAYMSVLQEKEEQIIQLKEEVSDLKTLVRVLEDDNDRLRRLTQGLIRQ